MCLESLAEADGFFDGCDPSGLSWGRERGRGDKPISSNGFYCALVLLLTKVEEEYHRMLDVGINTRLLRVDANLDCIIDCAVTRG